MRGLTVAAVLAAVALSGCGGDERTIPNDEGATLIRLLRNARDQAENLPDQCDALQRSAAAVQSEVQSLPDSVDSDTRQTLGDGADNLAQTAQEECQDTQTETTPPPTTETVPPEEVPPSSGGTPPGKEEKGAKKERRKGGHE